MEDRVATALSDIERRLSAVENRLTEGVPARSPERSAQGMIGGFAGVPIAV
jgi:hypothetical protein